MKAFGVGDDAEASGSSLARLLLGIPAFSDDCAVELHRLSWKEQHRSKANGWELRVKEQQ